MSAGEHNSFCWPEAGGKKRIQSTRRLRKGNGYPMQWICDNAKKSWTECLTFIKSNHANEKENGGEALRKVLTFDYVLV